MADEIADLFERNPAELTHDDITAIIEKMRKMRASFRAGDKRAGTQPRRLANKKAERIANVEIGEFDL